MKHEHPSTHNKFSKQMLKGARMDGGVHINLVHAQ